MKADELTLERVLTVWWAFVWRAGLASAVGGALAGFVGGFLVATAGSPDLARPVGAILGWLASIPCSIWAFREALRIAYQDFEIVFERRAAGPAIDSVQAPAPAPTKQSVVSPVTLSDASMPSQASPKEPEQPHAATIATEAEDSRQLITVLVIIGAMVFIVGAVAISSNKSGPSASAADTSATATISTNTPPAPVAAALSTSPPAPAPVPASASKSANMVLCDVLPTAASVTPAQVDAAFIARTSMSAVTDRCLTRQAYLLAATGR